MKRRPPSAGSDAMDEPSDDETPLLSAGWPGWCKAACLIGASLAAWATIALPVYCFLE